MRGRWQVVSGVWLARRDDGASAYGGIRASLLVAAVVAAVSSYSAVSWPGGVPDVAVSRSWHVVAVATPAV